MIHRGRVVMPFYAPTRARDEYRPAIWRPSSHSFHDSASATPTPTEEPRIDDDTCRSSGGIAAKPSPRRRHQHGDARQHWQQWCLRRDVRARLRHWLQEMHDSRPWSASKSTSPLPIPGGPDSHWPPPIKPHMKQALNELDIAGVIKRCRHR